MGLYLTGSFVPVIAPSASQVSDSEGVLTAGGAAYLEDDFGLFCPPIIHIDTEGHRNGQTQNGNS